MGLQYAHAPTPYVFPKLLHFPSMPQNLENPVTNEGVELGRYLFYDPILSRDSTFSCASCHRQEVAFSDASHRFSKGIGGVLTERNVAPLFNLAWYPTMFWDGKPKVLKHRHCIQYGRTMRWIWVGKSLQNVSVKAIFTHHYLKRLLAKRRLIAR